VLNQASPFDQSVLNEIPDWETNDDLVRPPHLIEVQRAINQLVRQGSRSRWSTTRAIQTWMPRRDLQLGQAV